MRSDRKWLGVIVAMQAIVVFLLTGKNPIGTVARADGIPDAGAQRDQMIEQLKATNEKLEKVLALLSGGDLRVKVVKSDDK